jgi:hypothetical protein
MLATGEDAVACEALCENLYEADTVVARRLLSTLRAVDMALDRGSADLKRGRGLRPAGPPWGSHRRLPVSDRAGTTARPARLAGRRGPRRRQGLTGSRGSSSARLALGWSRGPSPPRRGSPGSRALRVGVLRRARGRGMGHPLPAVVLHHRIRLHHTPVAAAGVGAPRCHARGVVPDRQGQPPGQGLGLQLPSGPQEAAIVPAT